MRRWWPAMVVGIAVLGAGLVAIRIRGASPNWPSGPVNEASVAAAIRSLGSLHAFWQVGAPAGVDVTEGVDGYRIVVRVRPAQVDAERLLRMSIASAAALFARLFEHPDVAFARLAVEQEFVDAAGQARWGMAVRLDMLRDRARQIRWREMAEDVTTAAPGWGGWLDAFSGRFVHPALMRELDS